MFGSESQSKLNLKINHQILIYFYTFCENLRFIQQELAKLLACKRCQISWDTLLDTKHSLETSSDNHIGSLSQQKQHPSSTVDHWATGGLKPGHHSTEGNEKRGSGVCWGLAPLWRVLHCLTSTQEWDRRQLVSCGNTAVLQPAPSVTVQL